mmetsp:Transcript_11797/g.29899  ORF Transcript_11797/g.29899 Transcript_11797/m.29899 type:complete len:1104 (-) Transcript_11797:44-3355(-)
MPLKNLFKRKKDKKKDAAKEAPSAAAKPAKGQGVNGDEVKKKLVTMVQLNDVTPNAQDGEFGNRGRFESYASGASSPSTSSGNISWKGDDSSGEGEGKSKDESKSSDEVTASTGGMSSTNGGGMGSKQKKKLYKHKKTGSAIDLENMLNEQNCQSLTSKVVHIEVPFGRPIEEVYDGVHSGPILGSGVSGLVRKVSHKKTGVEYAVKSLDLGLVETKEGLEQLRDEIFIMCQLDHPNIVRLEEVYESHSEIYLVQELCVGGELFDRLDEQPDYHYTEAECARLIKQMLCAVRYIHSKGIIHRDLKLENFLFSSNAPDSELKMIDFGLSKHFRYGEVQHEAVGTPYTVAPEVIRGQYDERCDIWAIGVIAFLLFSGDPPFGGCGGPEPLMVVRQNILDGDFEFEPAEIWDLVSRLGKAFVKDLLVTDPKNRPTAREAQKHAWLKVQASRLREDTGQDNVLNPNVVKALIGFKEFSDMRKLLSEVLSFTLLPDQIKDLRKEFEIMDTDGTGEISLDSLKEVLVSNAEAGSLGALTEEEVVDIFNAMRVNKEETTIHWHEFIAAGLTQCHVDDRNLRLAFDRLDSDHKGYITLNDIVNLVGSDDMQTEEEMRSMWTESMNNVGSTQEHITYDHFLLIMKGQTEKAVMSHHIDRDLRPKQLESVPEQEVDALTSDHSESHVTFTEEPAEIIAVPPPAPMIEEDTSVDLNDIGLNLTGSDDSLNTKEQKARFMVQATNQKSLPNLRVANMYDSEGSLGALRSGSPNASFTPPSAQANATWGTAPAPSAKKPSALQAKMVENAIPFTVQKPQIVTRRRSKSLESEQPEPERAESPVEDENSGKAELGVDTRRALTLPERDGAIKDELANMSALAVNRELYRAHRSMRVSVLEASRRFEETKAIRARDELMKEKVKEAMGAGLVMRHGTKLQVTSEAIRKYLDEAMAEQQALLEKANRRGGRGRRNRKKTISDMSAMMSPSMTQDEMGEVAKLSMLSQTPDSKRSTFEYSFEGVEGLPEFPKNPSPDVKSSLAPRAQRRHSGHRIQYEGAPQRRSSANRIQIPESVAKLDDATPNLAPQIDLKSLRKPTVPGRFLKTEDPFGASGLYGDI